MMKYIVLAAAVALCACGTDTADRTISGAGARGRRWRRRRHGRPDEPQPGRSRQAGLAAVGMVALRSSPSRERGAGHSMVAPIENQVCQHCGEPAVEGRVELDGRVNYLCEKHVGM